MMMDLPPPPPAIEEIIVQRVRDGEALILLGFVAFGADADVERLKVAAEAAALRGGRVPDDGEPETMVVFRPDDSRVTAMDLYHKALSGAFGKLRVEALSVSRADAADGVDAGKEIFMVGPAVIREN